MAATALLQGRSGRMTKEGRGAEFRMAAAAKKRPKAVADGAAGVLLASAEVAAPPERVFAALMSGEVERWWKRPRRRPVEGLAG